MASNSNFEEEAARRNYKAPYSNDHPIPTVQRYREHRHELNDQQKQAEDAQHTEEDDSKTKRALNSVKAIFKDEDKKETPGDPYPTANQNTNQVDREPGEHDSTLPDVTSESGGQAQQGEERDRNKGSAKNNADDKKGGNGKHGLSATEQVAGNMDPKQKRKVMKNNKRDDGGRVVTDPVTHLPLVIRDSTEKDMRRAPPNEPASGTKSRTATGLSGASKSSSQLHQEKDQIQKDYDGMLKTFPPPAFDDIKAELQRTYQFALAIGIAIVVGLATSVVLILLVMDSRPQGSAASESRWWMAREDNRPTRIFWPLAISISLASGVGVALIAGIRGWLGKKVEGIWEDEVWEAARSEEQHLNNADGHLPESTAWMNGLLAAVWPLINPDLFASIADMLEDVMQASLPKIIRMVSVDDLGQGSEPIRILGIRSLPTGAASQSVDEKGNLKPPSNQDSNDRGAPGEGEEEDHENKIKDEDESEDSKKKQQEKKQKETEQQAIREGMEAEQGDFVNMELAFAYRARSSGKSLKSKAKNAHLYLKFYLPGGIFVPVWVELRGIIGTMRLRLQLTPDPPFFSLCTLTFLGQPRADLSCVPLSKHLPNLMDVPLISSFVQSSIDAALAEYVAPKSLTLDLKDMLVGDDFKKDTVGRGIIVIFINEAQGFKEGSGGVGPLSGSSDSYITCSWGKFGKTVAATRVIEEDQKPIWHEWAYMLVTPGELNAEEKLRLQLWDSDKVTADDDLGRVEVDLKELMHSPKTKNQMCDREDRFMGEDPDEKMPGTLRWSVGYYAKTRITEEQLQRQQDNESIKTKRDLKKHVSDTAEKKLREATAHDESKEINQQKAQEYKEQEDALICASPPDSSFPTGILSIQIHNITGLELESLQKRDVDSGDREDEAEQSDDLPSSYCTLILNHKKVYRTRTKPKNSKPFFNAGTERFIRDWRSTEVMVSVRDSREGENDALLGIVYLPLNKVFEKRSQVMDIHPLVGGIGFGRIRISMIFRSVEMKLSKELLGWDYGTLEIKGPVKPKASLPHDLLKYRLKIRSNLARGKMSADDGQWCPKHERKSVFLACRNRYAMPLVIEFRKSSLGPDTTPAFAVFWLQDIPDEEERNVTLKVWKGGKTNLKRASTCAEYNGLDEEEQPLGEIEVTMRFWRGLSGYHKSYANKGKNTDVRDVMEVLDTVNDEMEKDNEARDDNEDDDDDEQETSDSESDSSDQLDHDSEEDEKGHESNGTHGKHQNNGVNTSKERPAKLTDHTDQASSNPNTDSEADTSSTRNPIKKAKAKVLDVVQGHNDPDNGSRGAIAQMKDYKDHRKQLHRKHRGVMQWKVARTADWALDKVRHGKGRVGEVFEHKEKSAGVETEV